MVDKTLANYSFQGIDNMSSIAYNTNIEVRVYQKKNSKEPFNEWLNSIRDIKTRARVDSRLEYLRAGGFGDTKSLGKGLFELRLHFGPGYRVYYGKLENRIIILLIGGDKSSQANDIQKAQLYWEDYKDNQKL